MHWLFRRGEAIRSCTMRETSDRRVELVVTYETPARAIVHRCPSVATALLTQSALEARWTATGWHLDAFERRPRQTSASS